MPRRALKNITVTLDPETAAWLRVFAAEQGKSVSRVVGEFLQERMRSKRSYDDAMRRYFAFEPVKFEWVDGRRPTREELHDRPGLR